MRRLAEVVERNVAKLKFIKYQKEKSNMIIPGYKPQNVKEFDELPQNLKDLFEETIQSHYQYKSLLSVAEDAKKRGNLVAALNTYKKLDSIRLITQAKLLQKQQEQTVSLLSMGLSREQLDKINTLTIAMYMSCDMIECFAMEVNEELQKVDKTARYEMFDPIIKIGKSAKENIRYLWKNTTMFETDDFGEQSDKMREMLINKAKKVYIKYAEHFGKEL